MDGWMDGKEAIWMMNSGGQVDDEKMKEVTIRW
jgi:hypothetical protein